MGEKIRYWVRPMLALTMSAGMLLAGAGCGYQFAGQSPLFSQNIHTVYVEPFISRSRDVGIDKELTSAFRSEFYRRGPLRVASSILASNSSMRARVAALG